VVPAVVPLIALVPVVLASVVDPICPETDWNNAPTNCCNIAARLVEFASVEEAVLLVPADVLDTAVVPVVAAAAVALVLVAGTSPSCESVCASASASEFPLLLESDDDVDDALSLPPPPLCECIRCTSVGWVVLVVPVNAAVDMFSPFVISPTTLATNLARPSVDISRHLTFDQEFR
jgi:hypothetical protein